MTPHYHFHLDESYSLVNGHKNGKSIVFGLLVPDEDKKKLAEQYLYLKHKHLKNVTGIKGKELRRKREYRDFMEELVPLTCGSRIKMVCMSHPGDTKKTADGDIREAEIINRDLYMTQALCESFLFFHPPLWIPESDYSIGNATRALPVRGDSPSDLLRELGYKTATSKDDDMIPYVQTFDTKGLTAFIKRRITDFAPFHDVTGVKSMRHEAEKTSKKSREPFAEWAKHLAGLLCLENDHGLANRLRNNLEINAEYGNQLVLYQYLLMYFLKGEQDVFLQKTLEHMCTFTHEYYIRQIFDLMVKVLDSHEIWGPRTSSVAVALNELTKKNGATNDIVFKLTNHLLGKMGASIGGPWMWSQSTLERTRLDFLNYRGDVSGARDLIRRIMCEKPYTVDEIVTQTELTNRFAVTILNHFYFDYAHQLIKPCLIGLRKSRNALRDMIDRVPKDPLISRFETTAGMALAFTAQDRKSHFDSARKLFINAGLMYIDLKDMIMQDVYLAHLYMDNDHEANSTRYTIKCLTEYSYVKAFLARPAIRTSEDMEYVLALFLKYELQTGKTVPGLSGLVEGAEKKLPRFFGEKVNTLPFQFIWSYLARMAFRKGDAERAGALFEKSLSVSHKTPETEPLTLTLRCQMLGIWAQCLMENGRNDIAMEKIETLVQIMKALTKNPESKGILTEDYSGWFGPSMKALEKAMAGRKDIDKSLDRFLKRFTFIYR